MKNKTCLIVCGGEFSSDYFQEFSQVDYVIAADSGFDNAIKMNLKPDLILGDFDSIKTSVSQIEEIKKLQLPCEKDDTDTMYAVKLALEKGFTRIFLACSFGNRLDHSFANLQTLAFINSKGGVGIAFGKGTRCAFLSANSSMNFSKNDFDYFSVFSAQKTSIVSIEGAKYNLEKGELTSTFPLGVSNQWENSEIKVTVFSGEVFVMEVREE